MRQARTGKKFEDQLDEEDIPSSEAAIQASKETLIAHKRCMEELEALRPRILAIVQESA